MWNEMFYRNTKNKHYNNGQTKAGLLHGSVGPYHTVKPIYLFNNRFLSKKVYRRKMCNYFAIRIITAQLILNIKVSNSPNRFANRETGL